jgi:hypothetical protein
VGGSSGSKHAAAVRTDDASRISIPLGPAAKVPQLLDAARRGDMAALAALLAGPNPPRLEAADPVTLRTALMEAAASGQEEMVGCLLESVAGTRLKDADGCTPLILGTWRGSVEVVRLLLRGGQRPNATHHYGWTALMHAAAGNHRAVVEELLAWGAQCGVRGYGGEAAEDLTTCPVIKGLLRVSWPLGQMLTSVFVLPASHVC